MKLKCIISICLSVSLVMAQVPSIDVSGRDGIKGSPGHSYNPSPRSAGFGSGSRGRSGGHAGPSTPGQNAGGIQVHLKDKEIVAGQPMQAVVEMDATFITADNNPGKERKTFAVGSQGFMHLQAKGGRGGGGGTGGTGEGGQDGANGSDATR
ncbi:MAG: hypothetical protein ACK5V3_13220, partial [Bdellovibrionales bacterium]